MEDQTKKLENLRDAISDAMLAQIRLWRAESLMEACFEDLKGDGDDVEFSMRQSDLLDLCPAEGVTDDTVSETVLDVAMHMLAHSDGHEWLVPLIKDVPDHDGESL